MAPHSNLRQVAVLTQMPGPQLLSPMTLMTEWAVSGRAFKRNRVSVGKKVVAAALCCGGYSYREVSKLVGGMSYIAVRDAYISLVTSFPEVTKRFRRAVAIDGSDVRLEGNTYCLWLARDIDSGEVIAFHASPTAAPEDGARFLSSVASECTNKPFVKLGLGENSPRGLLNLDLYFQAGSSQSIIGRLGRLFLGGS